MAPSSGRSGRKKGGNARRAAGGLRNKEGKAIRAEDLDFSHNGDFEYAINLVTGELYGEHQAYKLKKKLGIPTVHDPWMEGNVPTNKVRHKVVIDCIIEVGRHKRAKMYRTNQSPKSGVNAQRRSSVRQRSLSAIE